MGDNVWKSWSLHGRNGKRKYLNLVERELFLDALPGLPLRRRAFCLVLAFTGCRISEALSLGPDNLDAREEVLVFETLKQRRKGVYRAVPVPTELIELLRAISEEDGFFNFSRTTAWRIVKQVMSEAGIEGEEHAMPKGIRHSFGIAHAKAKTPQNLVQRWMGHTKKETTDIYQDAVEDEDREFASAIWQPFQGAGRKKFHRKI
jgi:integrase